MTEPKTPGLYVHVPFCRSKCPYCDFYSIASRKDIGRWLEAIDHEARIYAERFDPFDTLYIGGGTPTSLTDDQLAVLLDRIRARFTFRADTEVTLEANPNDITALRAGELRALGIDRISLGIQSFNADELRYLGRRNTVEQNERALQWIRSEGALRLAVDLIYGISGQTKESWLESLERVLRYRPEHISCYQLTIEEGTPFGKSSGKGAVHTADEEAQRDFFLTTSEYLEARGYLHYEISNFSRGIENMSRHNRKYWDHSPYLGLGPAAHSYQDGVRWWNFRSLEQYCLALETGSSPVAGSEVLSAEQLKLETFYLALRTNKGLSVQDVEQTPGSRSALKQLLVDGLVEIVDGRMIPTREGFLVADSLPLLFVD